MKEHNCIAIVGRPNVGKSALFNRIAGKRIAIVDKKPGITRDRIYTEVSWGDKRFKLIDTGGIIVDSKETIDKQIKTQADIAISEAHIILFVCDVNDGLTPLDAELFYQLKRAGSHIVLCVNKVDNEQKEKETAEFFKLGVEALYSVSAMHGLGINLLLDRITQDFTSEPFSEVKGIRIAVVGKPNVGKSSLVNYLLKEERSIVNDSPGTTRDSIDTQLTLDKQQYILIDTAGIKTSKKIAESVEFYSKVRSEQSIERCDVAVLVIDAQAGITVQDLKIGRFIAEKGKAAVIVVNKWDIVKGVMMRSYERALFEKMTFLTYAPVLFTSAVSGRNVDRILQEAQEVYYQGDKKAETRLLNKFLQNAVKKYQPPLVSGKRLKLFYMTQIGSLPPTFLLFVNYKSLIKKAYEQYLINQMHKEFGFKGNPVSLKYRNRRD